MRGWNLGGGGGGMLTKVLFNFHKVTENAFITIKLLIFFPLLLRSTEFFIS